MSSIRFVCILSATVTLAACGLGYSTATSVPMPSAPNASAPAASVSIPPGAATLGNAAFPPNPLTVSVGSVVTWVNTDTIAHTATSDAPGWDSGVIAAGGKYSRTFSAPGTFGYHCQIHPDMVGTIVVH